MTLCGQLRIIMYIQIQLMNASVAIVIVGNEQNNSLSWTSNFPPVLLTDDLDDQTHEQCNSFGRVAVRGKPHQVITGGHLYT